MQYNCLYKQIAYFNRTINLTITKHKKIKKQKDTVRNLCKYWLCYLFRLLQFQTSFKISFQSKNSFQFSDFKFFTGSLWNKGQSKMKRERNDENSCLLGFLRAQFLDSKAKTWGIAINILDALWELLHCWYTTENSKNKKLSFLWKS